MDSTILDSPETPINYSYAGFWWRFLAMMLDGILMNILSTIIGLIISIDMGFMSAMKGTSVAAFDLASFITSSVISFVINWLYFALMESSSYQATIGKRALGIRVTDMNGERISFGRASGRYFGKMVSAITLLIGYIMAAFTEKKQALHDIISGCLVVKQAEGTY
ncbi:MAG: RDD family protein [Bacteroidetes bacterium]|nr:RDD family protein [Bacteroidota bacterium]